MKKLIYIYIFLFIGFALSSNVSAQMNNVGTSAANFLKIGIGARAQGMGSAFVAQANDITALYWNPAGISNLEGRQAGFSQVDWITDVRLNFLGVVLPAGDVGSFGIAVTYLTMDEMDITTWAEPQGTGETFLANDLCFGLTWARKLTDRFAVGVQGKYIRETINQSSASAFALDIGTVYNTGFHGIKIGMALTNFGTKMQMSGRDLTIRTDPYPTTGSNPDDVWANLQTSQWAIPLTMRIGMSMDVMKTNLMRLTGNFDFYDENTFDQIWCVGGEASFMNEMFFLRGGMSPRDDDGENIYRASFGAGLIYSFNTTYSVILDYAYSDLGDLEEANRFSLAVTF